MKQLAWIVIAVAPALMMAGDESAKGNSKTSTPTVALPSSDAATVPDPRQVGGEADSVVQVANLIYAGVKSSQCFSDHFLAAAEKDSTISTSRRFHAVKLSSDAPVVSSQATTPPVQLDP